MKSMNSFNHIFCFVLNLEKTFTFHKTIIFEYNGFIITNLTKRYTTTMPILTPLKIMFKFTIFFAAFINTAKINEIEYFTGREIYMSFSAYTNTIIAAKTDDTTDNPFIGVNKELDPETFNYNDIAFITKYGDKYGITIGNYKLCKDEDKLKKCGKDEDVLKWKIKKNPFGYTISYDNYCITKEDDIKLELRKCAEADDQLLVFKNHVCLPDNNKVIVGNVAGDTPQKQISPYNLDLKNVDKHPYVVVYYPGGKNGDKDRKNSKKSKNEKRRHKRRTPSRRRRPYRGKPKKDGFKSRNSYNNKSNLKKRSRPQYINSSSSNNYNSSSRHNERNSSVSGTTFSSLEASNFDDNRPLVYDLGRISKKSHVRFANQQGSYLTNKKSENVNWPSRKNNYKQKKFTGLRPKIQKFKFKSRSNTKNMYDRHYTSDKDENFVYSDSSDYISQPGSRKYIDKLNINGKGIEV